MLIGVCGIHQSQVRMYISKRNEDMRMYISRECVRVLVYAYITYQ